VAEATEKEDSSFNLTDGSEISEKSECSEEKERQSSRCSDRDSIQKRESQDPAGRKSEGQNSTGRKSESDRERELQKLRFQAEAESHKVPLKKMISFGTLLQGCGTAVLACFMTLAQSSLSYSKCGRLLVNIRINHISEPVISIFKILSETSRAVH
jgi:hypothetical protein